MTHTVYHRLKNKEVLDVLRRWSALNLSISPKIVQQPCSGQIVLYDRAATKHFRRDAHGDNLMCF
jgi:hypothetical protein